ncbi:unnamed protein product [Acanthoscelides obtectus]|uniref:Uncharacterized protein n=1 Tax=Acanthoscelides obtectus TaxID=200917 RepID=A0A9P0LZV4_ACAOB|nr:unnamed protein product [Acanthoscelides obtectus]CAK1650683.1 hypothetical protein AOBTE_LOCUS16864 [Acanthoscelides obtectus]
MIFSNLAKYSVPSFLKSYVEQYALRSTLVLIIIFLNVFKFRESKFFVSGSLSKNIKSSNSGDILNFILSFLFSESNSRSNSAHNRSNPHLCTYPC